MMDDAVQPSCASREKRQNFIREALDEYLPAAQDAIATKTACHHQELNISACQRQIGSPPPISTMNAS
jgi:hypothetical protein